MYYFIPSRSDDIPFVRPFVRVGRLARLRRAPDLRGDGCRWHREGWSDDDGRGQEMFISWPLDRQFHLANVHSTDQHFIVLKASGRPTAWVDIGTRKEAVTALWLWWLCVFSHSADSKSHLEITVVKAIQLHFLVVSSQLTLRVALTQGSATLFLVSRRVCCFFVFALRSATNSDPRTRWGELTASSSALIDKLTTE